MESYPLVSVVVPTHSGSQVICRAVDSVLVQTYPNVEVIVVDDNGKGSIEQLATEKAMKKYISDSRVHYFAHDISLHGSAARNTGVKNSNGTYIALLDDDDYFLSDNINNHFDTLSKQPDDYGLSFCGMHIVRNTIEEEIISNYNGDVLLDFLLGKIRIGSSLIMLKKAVYEEFDGFDESFKRHQDWEFLTRIFTKYKLANVGKIGVVKINLDRNNAPNPEVFKQYRLYYLDKMKSIIDSLQRKDKQDVLNRHYIEIAKEYLRARKLPGMVYWCFKTSKPIDSLIKIIKSAFVYINKL